MRVGCGFRLSPSSCPFLSALYSAEEFADRHLPLYLALRRRGEGVVGVPALCQPREGLAGLRLMDTAPKRGGTCSEQNLLGAPCKLAWSVSRILRMWSRLA